MSFKEYLNEAKTETAGLEVQDVKKTIASLKKAGFKAKEGDDSVIISFSDSESLLKWAVKNGYDKDDFEF